MVVLGRSPAVADIDVVEDIAVFGQVFPQQFRYKLLARAATVYFAHVGLVFLFLQLMAEG